MARKSPSTGAKGPAGAISGDRIALLLRLFLVASLVGLGFALASSYIHYRLDTSAGDYVSFCNINESVDCDTVLSSRYASLLGLPVAWLGAAAHAVLALLAVAALQSRGRARTLRLQALVLGAIGGAVFSGYMALVSFGVLGTACLMCLGLYTAATAQLGLALMLVGAGDGNTRLFAPSALLAAALAMVVAVGLGGRYLWGAEAKTIDVDHASLAALREQDEKFFDWYLAQPVVEPGKLPGGAKAGTVVIVEFSDFECGYCKRNHSMVSELRARHPGAVSAIHRNFPLDPACNEAVDRMMHPNACRAAEAAECADAQGLYEPMAEVLFDNQERLFESNLGKLAEYAGLDAGLFDECMRTRATLGKIAADSREGKRLEVTSTPTLFINGRRIRGTFDSPEKYELAVAMELRLAAGDEPPAEYRPLANPQ